MQELFKQTANKQAKQAKHTTQKQENLIIQTRSLVQNKYNTLSKPIIKSNHVKILTEHSQVDCLIIYHLSPINP